jgi:hypothetical protein
MGYNKGMRKPSWIMNDINDLSREQDRLNERMEVLQVEYAAALKTVEQENLYEALSPIGVAVNSSRAWKNGKSGSYYYQPESKRYMSKSTAVSHYMMHITKGGKRLYAELVEWKQGHWVLEYTLENYGTRRYKPVEFSGTVQEAKDQAGEIIIKKILSIKKKLRKELDAQEWDEVSI